MPSAKVLTVGIQCQSTTSADFLESSTGFEKLFQQRFLARLSRFSITLRENQPLVGVYHLDQLPFLQNSLRFFVQAPLWLYEKEENLRKASEQHLERTIGSTHFVMAECTARRTERKIYLFSPLKSARKKCINFK